MLTAIVTSLDHDRLLATPVQMVDLTTLVGKKMRYVDKNDKIWPGVVTGIEDPFVIFKFDEYPSGLGQGQIVEIDDGSPD